MKVAKIKWNNVYESHYLVGSEQKGVQFLLSQDDEELFEKFYPRCFAYANKHGYVIATNQTLTLEYPADFHGFHQTRCTVQEERHGLEFECDTIEYTSSDGRIAYFLCERDGYLERFSISKRMFEGNNVNWVVVHFQTEQEARESLMEALYADRLRVLI